MLAGARVVASAHLHLREVVEGDVRRQPITPGASRGQALLDVCDRAVGIAFQQPNRAQPDEREGTGPFPVRATAFGDRQGPLEALGRGDEVATGERGKALARHGVRHGHGVAVGVRQRRGPLPERSGDVIEREGHGGCRELRAWQHARWQRMSQDALGQATSEDQMASQPPVHPQRPGEPRRAGGVACAQAALDGGGEVRVFEVDARQGLHLAAVPVARSQRLGDGQEVLSMGGGSALPLAGLPQPVAGVLRDGFEQSLPRAADATLGATTRDCSESACSTSSTS